MKSGAKRHLETALAFILSGIMLAGGTALATSARRTETIDVTYDNIQIVLDGKTIDPKDALGNKVEPFIYNGTTFLPVRAVGEAFGKEVSWDGTEKIVYVGAKPGEHENWLVQCKPYMADIVTVFSPDASIKLSGGPYCGTTNRKLIMAGKEYTEGVALAANNNGKGYMLFNLDGKYESLTFILGHEDSSPHANGKLNIYLDDKLVLTEEVQWDAVPREVTVPLNGALHMKIELASGAAWFGLANGYFE